MNINLGYMIYLYLNQLLLYKIEINAGSISTYLSNIYYKYLYMNVNFFHYFNQANSTVRLHDGRDHIWMPLHLDPILTNVTSLNRRLPQKFYYPSKGPIENSQEKKQLDGLYQPVKVDIRNIKRIKCVPIKYQKLPKNNIKLRCQTIKSNTDSSNTVNKKKTTNIKKILDDSQKKRFQSKFINVLVKKQDTLDRTKIENISKVSILLLYLHFLLCYYLSFSKTNQFDELFEMCSIKDNTN